MAASGFVVIKITQIPTQVTRSLNKLTETSFVGSSIKLSLFKISYNLLKVEKQNYKGFNLLLAFDITNVAHKHIKLFLTLKR